MIERSKWELGQIEERRHHIFDEIEGRKHYKNSYRNYFHYLQINPDLQEKDIIEIGPADFSALDYCHNHGNCYIIEPMPSSLLRNTCDKAGFTLLTKPAEEIDFPKVDEVWLMNVLQHVLDPNIIIDKAKKASKIIRFFEPIEAGKDKAHHHEFTMGFFIGHFGDCVQYYEAGQGIHDFHTHQCSYGIWIK